MKILLLLVFYINFGFNNSSVSSDARAAHIKKWEEFKGNYGKSYDDEEVERYRMDVFIKSVIQIQEHNRRYDRGEVSYKQGLNRFADLPADEFAVSSFCLHVNISSANVSRFMENVSGVTVTPTYLDWRLSGAVTRVKNQGDCGACWAFASAAALETSFYLRHNRLFDFSPQNLIDCVKTSDGCNGGLMGPAFQYVKENGINKEYDYGYDEMEETCRFQKYLAIPKIKDYQVYSALGEKQMRNLVTMSPIAVGIGVNSHFQRYQEGIFTDCSPELTHAVTIVGYGTSDRGEDYWIIKNSWGPDWGQGGYMLHQRGDDGCGLNNYVSIATF